MTRYLRLLSSGLLAAGILAVLPGTATANTVYNMACDNSGANHCYMVISEGEDKLANPYNDTASNVSSGSATVNSSSLDAGYMGDLLSGYWVNNELWLVTTPNPGRPYHASGWRPEWIEVGLTEGAIYDTTSGTTTFGRQFFWARNFFQSLPGSARYYYFEYRLSGTPSLNTNYPFKIQWNGSTWDVYKSGSKVVSGIGTQQAPGANQALQAGVEMTDYSQFNGQGQTYYFKDCGSVTGLSRVVNGSTYNYWSGNVYRGTFSGTNVFNITANSNTGISFQTARGC